MNGWLEQIHALSTAGPDADSVFGAVAMAAASLGFEYVAYGMQMSFPLSNPAIRLFSNYPPSWQRRYAEMNYIAIDPSVAHGRRCRQAARWSDPLLATAPQMWDEARSAGLCHGWFQSGVAGGGCVGMLTLARSAGPLGDAELAQQGARLGWLAQAAHQAFAHALSPGRELRPAQPLTAREVEVLRWTADGKTTGEIADILSISDHTVNFHVKNSMSKLQTRNKTATAVRAALLGLLA